MGGKSKIARELLKFVPRSVTHIGSPFIGGAGFELFLHRVRGITALGADRMYPLVNCWNHFLDDAPAVADAVVRDLPYTREKYDDWCSEWREADYDLSGVDWAARFWLVRMCGAPTRMFSFSPVMTAKLHSNMRSMLKSLRRFRAPGLTVKHCEFSEFLSSFDGFVYADPPYVDSEDVYDFRKRDGAFNHHLLSDLMCQRRGWVLSYNDCDLVRELYAGYHMHEIDVMWSSATLVGRRPEARELIISCPP